MNYLLRSKPKISYKKKTLTLAALFLVAAGFFSLLGGPIVSAISPVWRAENALSRSLGRALGYWQSKGALLAENEGLRQRITSLELELGATNLALTQGHTLSALLGRERRVGEVIAAVLTRPPQSAYDIFLIDAGSREGLALGSRVSLPEGPVVGTVSDVFSSSAKVKLFSSAGEKTEAVLERGNVPVVLEGRGAGNFRIRVPRETEVVIGDRVVSADVDYQLVGVVEDVEITSTDSFKEVLAKSPANIFGVRLVSIAP